MTTDDRFSTPPLGREDQKSSGDDQGSSRHAQSGCLASYRLFTPHTLRLGIGRLLGTSACQNSVILEQR
jgi:hypothetical protein